MLALNGIVNQVSLPALLMSLAGAVILLGIVNLFQRGRVR